MANVDAESGSSYSAFERFLIWFLIPFVFTSVLLGVLLTIFDYDIKNQLLQAANKVPGLNMVVPNPKSNTKTADNTPAALSEADAASKAHEDQLVQTSSRLAAAEQDIKSAEATIMQRDQQIKELQVKNSSLEEQLKGKTQSDEEYTTKIQQLATMYAKMTPTKSAPIMENLTLSEQVLVLSMMKTDDRVKILEKMDPKKAADASILLKDQSTVKDRELAALQDKIKQLTEAGTKPSQQLTKDDLGSTFAAMTPKSSAIVLLEMNNNNPDKVLSILSSMDSQGRSRILTAMTETSKETAALISARLVQ